MKKSKLAVGLMTSFLAVGVLASCDNKVKYSTDGIILSYDYTDADGATHHVDVKADDIFEDYFDDSTKYQSIFDSIYSIVVRNYFNHEIETVSYQGVDNIKLGSPQMEQINHDANTKVEGDIETAKTNADNNNTSYSDEFDAILSSKGVVVKDGETKEKALLNKYVEELQKETFDENFYRYHIDDIKLGKDDVKIKKEIDGHAFETNFWTGYFEDMVPYHVSHILVKLEDSSGTNYWNGTISEANAQKLYDVVNQLALGEDSFRTIAKDNSEDSSADIFGDLGIMDYSTSYVNEFKLGIYAYENLFGRNQDDVHASQINMKNVDEGGIDEKYTTVMNKAFDIEDGEIPTIPFSVFKELKEYKDAVKDEKEKSVLDDSANFYPRNIIYNKYLNRHAFAFITNDEETGSEKSTCGFHKYSEAEIPALKDQIILSAKIGNEWNPILTVRAGSGYEGIHFIVVNRSPFAKNEGNDASFVELNEYYTTFYPAQDGYPVYANGTPKKTYINFSYTDDDVQNTSDRADSLVSTLKSYDSDKLNKYIYKKYKALEGIHITDEKIEKSLDTWIDRGIEKKAMETEDSWEKTWNDYIDTLRKQNSARSKLISEACKIGYQYANDSRTLMDIEIDGVTLYEKMAEFLILEGHEDDIEEYLGTSGAPKLVKELFKSEGGLCNDGKEHF